MNNFSGWVWDRVQQREIERQKQLEVVRADEQGRVANARGESDIVIRLCLLLRRPTRHLPRGIALAALLNLANKKVLSLELASSVQVAIDLSQQRIRDGNAIEAERVAVGKIAAADDRPVAAPNGAALPVPDRSASVAQRFQVSVPRVYVQIFDEAGRDQARALQEWCTKPQRWLVPGIENVSAGSARESDATTGSGTGEVRFFHE